MLLMMLVFVTLGGDCDEDDDDGNGNANEDDCAGSRHYDDNAGYDDEGCCDDGDYGVCDGDGDGDYDGYDDDSRDDDADGDDEYEDGGGACHDDGGVMMNMLMMIMIVMMMIRRRSRRRGAARCAQTRRLWCAGLLRCEGRLPVANEVLPRLRGAGADDHPRGGDPQEVAARLGRLGAAVFPESEDVHRCSV